MLFGPRRMHEVLRALGRASRQLQTAVHEIQNELDEATRIDESPAPKTPPTPVRGPDGDLPPRP